MAKIGAGAVDLDALKRALATAIVDSFPMDTIRQYSLANIERWNSQGVQSTIYEEWKMILLAETNEELRATITVESDRSVRLRQSPPFIGLLPLTQSKAIKEAFGQKVDSPLNYKKSVTD